MVGEGVRPSQVENRIGKLSALLLVQIADLQENLRDDVLIEPRVARRRQRRIFPLEPARRVGEAAVLFREPGARQTVYRRVDLLLLLWRGAGSVPELARFVRIDPADH